MNVQILSMYAIMAVVVIAVVYMFFYEEIASKKQPNDKYKAIYDIAKMIVDNFDPAEAEHVNVNKAVTKVQDQAKIDGLQVTDDVAAGAVKKAVQDKQQESPKNQGFFSLVLIFYFSILYMEMI